MRLAGHHNAANALCVAAAAWTLGVPAEDIALGLSAFGGVGRRLELKGEPRGATIVDDYAHHPTEIRATLSAARQGYPHRRIVALFQPHLFSRTRDFAAEFGRALTACDLALVTDVYPSREKPLPGVTTTFNSHNIRSNNCQLVSPFGVLTQR